MFKYSGPFRVLMFAACLSAICGCSREKASTSTAATESSSSTASASMGIQPCKLLTAAQVNTVLPNNDGGMVAHAGGSFLQGVDAYQCSYTDKATNLLTVVLNIAVDDARFEKIKPGSSSHSSDQKIDVGDAGWLYGDDNDAKVEVVKGHTIIDLELMAPGAKGKSAALIDLARAVAQKVQ